MVHEWGPLFPETERGNGLQVAPWLRIMEHGDGMRDHSNKALNSEWAFKTKDNPLIEINENGSESIVRGFISEELIVIICLRISCLSNQTSQNMIGRYCKLYTIIKYIPFLYSRNCYNGKWVTYLLIIMLYVLVLNSSWWPTMIKNLQISKLVLNIVLS